MSKLTKKATKFCRVLRISRRVATVTGTHLTNAPCKQLFQKMRKRIKIETDKKKIRLKGLEEKATRKIKCKVSIMISGKGK